MRLHVRIGCKSIELLLRAVHSLRTKGRTRSSWLVERLPPVAQPEKSRQLPPGLLVVIPFRDKVHLTKQCFQSCLTQTGLHGTEVRIVLVDNGSQEATTAQWLASLPSQVALGETTAQLHLLRLEIPFNFSRLNNEAVSRCGKPSDLILCLNNDITFTSPGSLQTLLEFFRTPGVGAVGATLRYPSGRLQHAFVAPGVKLGGCHLWRGDWFPKETEPWFDAPRAVPAVTGAFLACTKQAYDQVGGYDEALATAYQDLDLCLAFEKAGFTNWVLPDLELIHFESATRSTKLNREELNYLYAKWGSWLAHHPGLPPDLSRWSEWPVARLMEGAYPWRACLAP